MFLPGYIVIHEILARTEVICEAKKTLLSTVTAGEYLSFKEEKLVSSPWTT